MNGLLVFMLLCAMVVETSAAASRECVILIHGLGAPPLTMLGLKWTLQRAGYQVVNLHYPSRSDTIERLAQDYLEPVVRAQSRAGYGQIHFVTHSMGGILVRQYLASHSMTNLGRVVMLAPPNHGNKIIDRLKETAIGRWILGPAGCELGTGPTALPARLGPAHYPLGIIAAASDWQVRVPGAKLEGMSDYRLVSGRHSWIVWKSESWRQVLSFLKTGQFLRRVGTVSAEFSLL